MAATQAHATTRFVFLFTENMDDIAKLVTYNEFKVLIYCIKMMRYGNLVSLSLADIAWGALQQNYTSTASKIFASLKQKKILIADPEAPRSFFVNPNLVACGSFNNFVNKDKSQGQGWKIDEKGERHILSEGHPLQATKNEKGEGVEYTSFAPIAIADEPNAAKLKSAYNRKARQAAADDLIARANARAERIKQEAAEEAEKLMQPEDNDTRPNTESNTEHTPDEWPAAAFEFH